MRGKKAIILAAFFILYFFSNRWEWPSQEYLSEEQRIAKWKNDLKAYPPSRNAKEIELLLAFPGEELIEKDIYLWKAACLGCDADGNIFVVDLQQKTLLKFDSKGGFLKKAGRKGQGPGEFLNPLSMSVADDRIWISDTGKYEILIFDLELNFIKSYKTRKAYIAIAGSRDGKAVGAPFRMNNNMPLVDVMDDEGRILTSFGKAMYGSDINWTMPNFIKIDVSADGMVYLAYWHFPTVCRYDMNGRWMNTYSIRNRVMKVREKANLESIRERRQIFWPVVRGIRAKKDGFYLMHEAPLTHILEYDEKGEEISDYWFIRSHDYRAADFFVNEGRDLLFVLLQESPEHKIEVFRPKKR